MGGGGETEDGTIYISYIIYNYNYNYNNYSNGSPIHDFGDLGGARLPRITGGSGHEFLEFGPPSVEGT
jgi:hypothetical protein